MQYAIFNEGINRLKAADEAASGAPAAIPGWLQTLLDALMKVLGGGCLPPVAKAADLTKAVADDTNGYIESVVRSELRQNHGPLVARLLTRRGMTAIRFASAALKPEDDGFAAQLQASAAD